MELEMLRLKYRPTNNFSKNRKLTLSGFNISALDTIALATQKMVSERLKADNLHLPDNSYVVITITCCCGRVDFILGNAKAMVTSNLLRKRIARCHSKLDKVIKKGTSSGRVSIIDNNVGFAASITGCDIIKQQDILSFLLSEIKRRWISSQA